MIEVMYCYDVYGGMLKTVREFMITSPSVHKQVRSDDASSRLRYAVGRYDVVLDIMDFITKTRHSVRANLHLAHSNLSSNISN